MFACAAQELIAINNIFKRVNRKTLTINSFFEKINARKKMDNISNLGASGFNTDQIPENFKWTEKEEQVYQKNIKKADEILGPLTINSKFLNSGLIEIVRKMSGLKTKEIAAKLEMKPAFIVNFDTENDNNIMPDKKNNNLRDQLLDKYMNGHWMTLEEIKYICMTSVTLNLFLNKKFYQKASDILDPDFINEIEINIADQITRSYYNIQDQVKDNRKIFLKRQNNEIHNKVYQMQRYQEKHCRNPIMANHSEAQSEQLLNTSYIKLQTDQIRSIMYKAQVAKNQGANEEKNSSPKRKKSNGIRFEYKKENWLTKRRSSSNPRILNSVKAKNQKDKFDFCNSVNFGRLSKKTLIHKQHPPSKILSFEQTYTDADKEQNKKEESLYKLDRLCDEKFCNKKDFIRVNSTGPLDREYRLRRPKDLIIRAVLYIQKIFRGYLQRKQFKQYIKDKSIFEGMVKNKLKPPSVSLIYNPKQKKELLLQLKKNLNRNWYMGRGSVTVVSDEPDKEENKTEKSGFSVSSRDQKEIVNKPASLKASFQQKDREPSLAQKDLKQSLTQRDLKKSFTLKKLPANGTSRKMQHSFSSNELRQPISKVGNLELPVESNYQKNYYKNIPSNRNIGSNRNIHTSGTSLKLYNIVKEKQNKNQAEKSHSKDSTSLTKKVSLNLKSSVKSNIPM